MRRWLGGTLAMGLLLAGAPLVCGAQGEPPAPCSVEPEPVPCGSASAAKDGAPAAAGKSPTATGSTTTGKQSSTERFPFPGESSGDSSAAGPALPDLSGAPAPAGTATNAASGTSSGAAATAAGSAPAADAAKKAAAPFPFPEEEKGAAAGSGTSGGLDLSGANKDSPNSSSSSSSSSSSNAGDDAGDAEGAADSPGLKDKGSEGSSGRHLLHRVNPVATKLQSPEEREAEDLSVAHYYSQSGNFAGAYLRSQDAVKTVPDDPDAHFALAEAALKLNKREEAIAEYNACLKLDPSDKEAKAARKALERLVP